MSTPKIYAAVIAAAARFLPAGRVAEHLDIGAGRGELIMAFRMATDINSCACDFHIERFADGSCECVSVDINENDLPYPDHRFDLVTCSEVVEHLENFRHLVRESFRVTSHDGGVIITTPNVLNVASRLRYFTCGFANLFGPLPVRNERRYSTGGHISPIPYFYLAHALVDAGFDEIQLGIDKVQRSSAIWTCILFPILTLGWWRFLNRERNRFQTLTPENSPLVLPHFSWRLLTGRTVIISARKPSCRSS